MKIHTVLIVLTVLFGAITLQAGEAMPDFLLSLIVELEDQTAEFVRNDAYVPDFIDNLNVQNPQLIPLFKMPSKAKNQPIWYKHGLNRWFIVKWESKEPVVEVASRLRETDGLIRYEILRPYKLFRTPNDYENFDKWDLDAMRLPDAWDSQTGSREVVIATIDTGCEIAHPDISANLWINPGEDVNGNGVWDEDDNNDEDDDDNGFVDDIIGWDFVDFDLEQLPEQFRLEDEDYTDQDNQVYPDIVGHGTIVASIAAGVTNNGEGIAAASWNVRSMSLRTGFAIDVGMVSALIQPETVAPSIQYAADNGARIISMSFGASNLNEIAAVEVAVNYAHDLGVIMFAAAGNDDNDEINYPACYDNVLAVAATDQNDVKANFSCFGEWVSLSAPGVAISSCSAGAFDEDNGYGTYSGTSMSSPNAAAVAGLVLSVFPEMEVDVLEEILLSTCDPIDDNNPDHRGQLGAGRLNAFAAVQMAKFPVMDIQRWIIMDDNENYHPDPGETCELSLLIQNMSGWSDAESFNVEFNIENDLIEYDENEFEFGEIPAQEVFSTDETPFIFTVSEDFPEPDYISISVSITTQPGDISKNFEIELLVGTPQLILVDDDGGSNLDEYIREDLNNLEVKYFHHDLSALGLSPQPDHLAESGAVIWMTGNNADIFLENEVEILEDAIDSGTNLFIFGQNIDELLSFYDDFYYTYLHAESVEGETCEELVPVENGGGPYRRDFNMMLNGQNGAQNSTDPDVIQPIDGAMPAFRYYRTESIGGIYYEDEIYKLVYFPFAFEAVSDERHRISRQDMIESILTWFDEETGVPDLTGDLQPENFRILSAYPNPFNALTRLTYVTPVASHISIKVYDISGSTIATLFNGAQSAGYHVAVWDSKDIAAGIYFARMESVGFSAVRKITLVK